MTKRRGTFRRKPARVVQTELEVRASQTVELLQRVNELIVESDAVVLAPEPGGHALSKRAVFPAPWNTPAGNLFTTIGQAARDHEQNLTLLLFGGARFRGTSDQNTYAAIDRLPDLIRAAVRLDLGDHQYVKSAVAALIRWPAELRRFLDEDPYPDDPKPWTKAPGDLRCPHCQRPLWLRPGWQHSAKSARVWCQRCTDAEGRLLSWEPSVWIGVLQHSD